MKIKLLIAEKNVSPVRNEERIIEDVAYVAPSFVDGKFIGLYAELKDSTRTELPMETQTHYLNGLEIYE